VRPSLSLLIPLCALLGACSLSASGTASLDHAGGSGGASTAWGTGGQTSIGTHSGGGTGAEGGAPPVASLCDPSRKDLLGCYHFDGNVIDGSLHANHTTAAGITYVPGVHGSAIETSAASDVEIPDRPDWDVNAVTIEMWIRPNTLPAGKYGDDGPQMGLLDKDGQFGVFLLPGGRLRCSAASHSTYGGVAGKGVFTHVACASDGATVQLYVNAGLSASGSTVDMKHSSSFTRIGANAPSGDAFDGAFDDLRIWSVVRTQSEICEAAGRHCG
jgi:Concanavalin A-like lectin/glucanases superfamily